MIIQTKLLIIMLILFLASALTFGSASRYGTFVSAVPNNLRCSTPVQNPPGYYTYTCCWENEGSDGVTRTWCQRCTDWDTFEGARRECSDPTSFAVTKGPSLPSPPTNVLPPGNTNTSTFPFGSIIKVSPGTTSAFPGNNSNGTLPTLTITKEHNPASPNILSSAGNATNPSNNTSTSKLSPLASQKPQTSGGHHHHKGFGGNTNSTGH